MQQIQLQGLAGIFTTKQWLLSELLQQLGGYTNVHPQHPAVEEEDWASSELSLYFRVDEEDWARLRGDAVNG